MLLTNKIKQSQYSIESKSNHFKNFIQTLRQNRSHILPISRKLHSGSKSDQHNIGNDYPSQSNHSELLHINQVQNDLQRSSNNISSENNTFKPSQGDHAIRNKLRFSVANRHRVDRYRLPAYCFQQIKQDLGEHLREVKGDSTKLTIGITKNKHKQAQIQEEFNVMMENKGISGLEKPKKISALNPTIVLKYCLINKIYSESALKEIIIFFARLLQLLNYQIDDPKVERYKNCIYFGEAIRKNQIYEGIVYYFSGSVYYGQLFNNQKQGFGVQIDLQQAHIFKGQFRNGDMVGYFQVQKDGEKYYGELQNGLYHGHGKLIDSNEVFEGQFRAGKKIYNSPKKSNQFSKSLLNKKRDHQQYQAQSAQKYLTNSKTGYFEFSKNKIYPINNSYDHNASLNMISKTEKKKFGNKRYIDQAREFSYPFNHQFVQCGYNPQLGEKRKNSKIAALRIRQVGKFHSAKISEQQQQDEQKPLRSKI